MRMPKSMEKITLAVYDRSISLTCSSIHSGANAARSGLSLTAQPNLNASEKPAMSAPIIPAHEAVEKVRRPLVLTMCVDSRMEDPTYAIVDSAHRTRG